MHGGKNEFQRLESEFGWSTKNNLDYRDGVWYSRSHHSGISFPTESFGECASLEQNSFWFSHRNDIIGRVIERLGNDFPIWDVGAGNGAVSAFLKSKAFETVSVEPSPLGAVNCAKMGVGIVACSFLEDLHLPSKSIKFIGSFDVIEHLSEPSLLLNEFQRILAPGGLVIVTVPAYQWLWSQTDSYAGHFSRFDKSSLTELFERSGFTEKYSTYFFSPLVLPVWLMRVVHDKLFRKSDKKVLLRSVSHLSGLKSKTVDKVLTTILKCEQTFLSKSAIPFGTSLLAVFESK